MGVFSLRLIVKNKVILSNRFADEPQNEGVSKRSKQESDASRRSYRELTDKCQVSVIKAVVS